MTEPDGRDRQIETLRERLSRLSDASLRINESLDLDDALQGVLDSARILTGARYGVITTLDDRGWMEELRVSGMYRRPSWNDTKDKPSGKSCLLSACEQRKRTTEYESRAWSSPRWITSAKVVAAVSGVCSRA